MNKKYIVRLSDEERGVCQEIIKKLKGSSQKVRRAQILLKADADGPAWTDAKIAEAFDCRVQTIENVRKRLVTEGFELALEGKKRQEPPTPPKLDGEARSEVDRHAVGQAAGGLRTLDVATAGRRTGGLGGRRFDQPRDGPQDAKKNGMTKRKIEYWVIPPEQTASSSPAWKKCSKPTRKPTIRSIPCCAWTSSRCSCSGRRGCRSRRRRSIASGSITNTNARARPAFSCSPNRSRASGRRRPASGGPRTTGRSKSPSCWIRATRIASG